MYVIRIIQQYNRLLWAHLDKYAGMLIIYVCTATNTWKKATLTGGY
jgi:hypothetical protein